MKFDRHLLRIFLRHSVPMLLAIGILGISSTAITTSTISRSTTEKAENTLRQIITYYDSVMDELDSINAMLVKNPEVITNLKQIHDITQMDYQLFRETQIVKSFMNSSANTRESISAIFLYIDNDSGYILYSGSGYETLKEVGEEEWVCEYMKKAPAKALESERRGYNIVRLSRPILDRDKEKIGVIIVDVRISELVEFFDSYTEKPLPLMEVYNENGESLFSYSKGKINTKNIFSIEMTSRKYGWKYSLSYDRYLLFRQPFAIFGLTFLAMCTAALVGFISTYKANKEERRFLSNLIDALNKAGAELEEPEGDGNIFSKLDDLILRHFLEQDYLKLRAEALEYRALQMQINPHFLFNSLNNIYWKSVIMYGGENDLSQMTKLLSSLMKHSLRFDNLKGIPLGEELESVDTYIKMQRFRFKDTFSFEKSVPEDLLDMPVPAMLFQPLLENAFNHGFLENRILDIHLSAVRESDMVRFEISDDGRPFPENILNVIRDRNAQAVISSSSLGLLNTRDRIALFYNHKGSMSLENRDGLAVVTIIIPIEREEDPSE